MKYNKLVRDNIPEIIKEKGGQAIIHIASDEEYLQKLYTKLQEEVNEFLQDFQTEELVDILEVIYALAHVYGVNKEQLEILRKEKAKKRGGFEKRIILEETK